MFNLSEIRNGIYELRIDKQGHAHNVMDTEAVAELEQQVEMISSDDAIRGVVVTSAKSSFVAGGDLDEILKVTNPGAARALVAKNRHCLRKLEQCGKPVVAALNGAALGGGLEMALACMARVAANTREVVLGLPEVGLGLMPGAGGTQRLPYIVGVEMALKMALGGKPIPAAEALKAGLIDALVDPDDLLDTAVALIEDGKVTARQPWDEAPFLGVIPDPETEDGREILGRNLALVTGRAAQNEPAPAAIVSAMCDGLRTDMDSALGIEQDQFVKLATGPVAKNKIRTLFFGVNGARTMSMRPKDVPPYKVARVGVIGAGLMGSGIAHVAAKAGCHVSLIDISIEAAEKGKAAIAKSCQRAVEKGRMRSDAAEALLARIDPTTEYETLAEADLVIEAVSEVVDLKHRILAQASAAIRPGVPLASNTSTLPITGLAGATDRPEDMIGLHFFAPVDRMPFVEVIRGDGTSDQTLARALDFMRMLRKSVVVVGDGLGFFTSRVVAAYTGEALTLLAEGVDPEAIDKAALDAGMPLGPLAMADMTSLTLLKDIYASITGDGTRQGLQGVRANEALARMVDEFGRSGRAGGGGIYDYVDGKPAPWAGLRDCFPAIETPLSAEDIEKRLMYAQSLETARLLEEGVLARPIDGDVGSVLGWSFPSWTGGAASYVDTVGVGRFVHDCDAFRDRFGGRFEVPELLRNMAREGETFHGTAKDKARAEA